MASSRFAKDDNAMDRLVSEIGSLVTMARKCAELASDVNVSPDVLKKIAELEANIKKLDAVNQEVGKLNENLEKKVRQQRGSPGLPGTEVPPLKRHEANIIKRLESFKNEIDSLQSLVMSQMFQETAKGQAAPGRAGSVRLQENSAGTASQKIKNKDEKRKGKFTPLGGKKNWLPM